MSEPYDATPLPERGTPEENAAIDKEIAALPVDPDTQAEIDIDDDTGLQSIVERGVPARPKKGA